MITRFPIATRYSSRQSPSPAMLTAIVPNPGEPIGSGKGVKVAGVAGALSSKAVSAPGKVKLTIGAKRNM
jgi:hypothetical protein